jgi:hypothetical protein
VGDKGRYADVLKGANPELFTIDRPVPVALMRVGVTVSVTVGSVVGFPTFMWLGPFRCGEENPFGVCGARDFKGGSCHALYAVQDVGFEETGACAPSKADGELAFVHEV